MIYSVFGETRGRPAVSCLPTVWSFFLAVFPLLSVGQDTTVSLSAFVPLTTWLFTCNCLPKLKRCLERLIFQVSSSRCKKTKRNHMLWIVKNFTILLLDLCRVFTVKQLSDKKTTKQIFSKWHCKGKNNLLDIFCPDCICCLYFSTFLSCPLEPPAGLSRWPIWAWSWFCHSTHGHFMALGPHYLSPASLQ